MTLRPGPSVVPRDSHRDRSFRSRSGSTTEAVGTGCVSNTVEERAALEAQVHIQGKMKSVEIAEVIVKEPRNFTYMNGFSRLTLTYMAHTVNVCV